MPRRCWRRRTAFAATTATAITGPLLEAKLAWLALLRGDAAGALARVTALDGLGPGATIAETVDLRRHVEAGAHLALNDATAALAAVPEPQGSSTEESKALQWAVRVGAEARAGALTAPTRGAVAQLLTDESRLPALEGLVLRRAFAAALAPVDATSAAAHSAAADATRRALLQSLAAHPVQAALLAEALPALNPSNERGRDRLASFRNAAATPGAAHCAIGTVRGALTWARQRSGRLGLGRRAALRRWGWPHWRPAAAATRPSKPHHRCPPSCRVLPPTAQAASAPAGFEVITLAEAESLANTGTFRWLTEADRTLTLAEATAREEEDRRRIEALAAADPELARRLVDPTPGPRVEAMPDGNWRVTLRPGDPGSPAFVTQGRRFAIQDLATGWREGASRSNREGLFRTLIAALPEDLREGLPNADNLAGVADSVLDAAITTVTDRVNTSLDSDGLPANPEPLSESFPSPISGLTGILPSGCLNYGPAGLYARNSWPLKTSLTPVRNQGGRGTCTSFGIAGAMETFIKHNYGRSADLSEQLLYGTAKGEWFFDGPDRGWLFLGDGLPLASDHQPHAGDGLLPLRRSRLALQPVGVARAKQQR